MDDAPRTGTCTSCGDEDVERADVHRVYLVWSAEGEPIGERVVADVECWCASCLTQYPHRLA